METAVTMLVFAILVVIVAVPYWRRVLRAKNEAETRREKSVRAGLIEPATLHPRIDLLGCIGCASCVRACPEDVLGIVGGRAAIVNPTRCVGHAICVEVCPVGAITMGFGTPTQGMEIPFYDEHYQSNIPGLYIIGELGGIGLLKNAFEQGQRAVEHIAAAPHNGVRADYELAIIGAGPAGISAALAAHQRNIKYIVLEQYDLGGSVLHYPRNKLILTSPVDLPLHGKLDVSEISKEELLELFVSLSRRHALRIQTQKKVESVTMNYGILHINTGDHSLTAHNVILALGRRGSPRKLGVPGEELPKVYYRLIEAETYTNKHLLVVGGGDSAVEAAVALARQKGNTVTLSYRREEFVRLKEKNEVHIHEMMRSRKVNVLFNTEVQEIRRESVALLEKKSILHEVQNENVFVFAGGELPGEFLKKTGVHLRMEASAQVG